MNLKTFMPLAHLGLLLAMSFACLADDHARSGYSYLGVGSTSFSYDETASSSGLSINSKADGGKLTQRSGAYVSVSPRWGFYLISSSFLGSDSIGESWDINGVDVQKNRFTIKRSEVQALVTQHLSGKHYLIYGGGNIESSFTRFDFTYPQQDQFIIDEDQANVTEDVSQYLAFLGYEYNEFFVGTEAGVRYQFQALVGVPVFSEILNNSTQGASFDTSFDGYSVRVSPAVGWQFGEHVLVSFSAEISLEHRGREEKIFRGEKLILPENDFFRIYPALSLHWAF